MIKKRFNYLRAGGILAIWYLASHVLTTMILTPYLSELAAAPVFMLKGNMENNTLLNVIFMNTYRLFSKQQWLLLALFFLVVKALIAPVIQRMALRLGWSSGIVQVKTRWPALMWQTVLYGLTLLLFASGYIYAYVSYRSPIILVLAIITFEAVSVWNFRARAILSLSIKACHVSLASALRYVFSGKGAITMGLFIALDLLLALTGLLVNYWGMIYVQAGVILLLAAVSTLKYYNVSRSLS